MPDKKDKVQQPASADSDIVSDIQPPADLWKQFDAIRESVSVQRPEGGITTPEWAKLYGITTDQAYKEIMKAVEQGKLRKHPHGSSTYYTKI